MTGMQSDLVDDRTAPPSALVIFGASGDLTRRKLVPGLANLARHKRLPDEFAVVGKDVYLRCPKGYGVSKLSNAFWEKKLGTVATTRNWNTVGKLAALLS